MALCVAPGDQFGRLTVLSRASRNKHGYLMYGCVCTCGRKKLVRSTLLVHGQTRSCGCLRSEETAARHRMKRRRIVQISSTGAEAHNASSILRSKYTRRRKSFVHELENWPLRSKLVFRLLRCGRRLSRREIETATLLNGDAVAVALEHLMRIGEVTEERGARGYRYVRSLQSLSLL